MSSNDRPEVRAYRELETLVRSLGEELAAFRRRALSAEAQLKDAGGHGTKRGAAAGERVAELETENESLKTRVERAEDRVTQMMDRVKFLRQQLQSQPNGAGASRS